MENETCRSCNRAIPPGDNYCDDCTCPSCRGSKPPDGKYCDTCQEILDEIAFDEGH